MADDLTKEEIERRARDLARKVMAKPPEAQEWPKNAPARKSGKPLPKKRPLRTSQ